VATRRKRDADSAARIPTGQLVDLIDDIRTTLARGTRAPATLEAALAHLEAEALRRNIKMPAVAEPRMVPPPDEQIDQEFIRTVLSLSAQAQELKDFADAVRHADLTSLWFAFQQARSFTDADERMLAINHIAYRVTNWLASDPDHASAIEGTRTERLSEVEKPLAWLEQELLRLFHHTLRFGGDPTKHFDGQTDTPNSR